ncbi:MAG: hypothetical protein R2746_13085 [Acidimicrobiales bacterium]
MRNCDAITPMLHRTTDWGCAVAAAELGALAGADRVEGCLFGNGERTGNVDLVRRFGSTCSARASTRRSTSATSTPSAAGRVLQPAAGARRAPPLRRATSSTRPSPARTRTPSSSSFALYAESERLAARDKETWGVPYLPIDPAHVGRTYEAVIRVNSQSGKGVAYIMEVEHGFALPGACRSSSPRRSRRSPKTPAPRSSPRGHVGRAPGHVPPRGARLELRSNELATDADGNAPITASAPGRRRGRSR